MWSNSMKRLKAKKKILELQKGRDVLKMGSDMRLSEKKSKQKNFVPVNRQEE